MLCLCVYAYGTVPEGADHPPRCDILLCGHNTDMIIMAEALKPIRVQLLNAMDRLAVLQMNIKISRRSRLRIISRRSRPQLESAQRLAAGSGYGSEDLNYVLDSLKLLGCKGTTGTQASFWSCSTATTRNAASWM